MDGFRFERTYKNERLKEIIRKAVVDGDFPPGGLLPSQNEMCAQFGVSIHTVREAIASLVHEGLLHRVHGKGTFVAARRLDRSTIAFVTTRLHRDLGTHYRLGYDAAPMLVQAVEEEARASGAGTILCLTHDDIDAERECLLDLVDRRVGGIVLYYIGGHRNLDCLQAVQKAGIPLVLVDRRADGIMTDYVVTDNFRGAYDATQFLIDSGFPTIYHITLDTESTALRERSAGFRQALEDNGVPFHDSLVRSACAEVFPNLAMGADFHEAGRITRELLEEAPRPFGVFAASSTMLNAVWRMVQFSDAGHSEIGLACFDVPIQSIPRDVALIKVVQPLEKMAKAAVGIVLDKLKGKLDLQQIILEPSYRAEGAGKSANLRGVNTQAEDLPSNFGKPWGRGDKEIEW